jgi:hypothetical protein
MSTATQYRHPVPVVRGQYQLTNPDTGTVQKLQRVTNRIGILADRSGLNKWLNRTALAGLAARPDLILQVNQAAQADDNRRLDDLAETAREAGGGNTAAALGTALHSVFEAYNLDGTRPTDPTAAMWLDGVIAAMTAAGMTVDPMWVERVVANFELNYAGQIDAAVFVEGSDDTFLIDLKTGKDVRYGLNEYCLQLHTYAHASHSWEPSTNTCTPIGPDALNRDYGYIIHAPVDLTQGVTIYELDLAAAAPAVAMIDQIKAWRKAKVGEPIDLTPAPEPVTRLGWITTAIGQLAEHDGCLETLAKVWPPGVPTLRAAREGGVTLTPLECDAIFSAITNTAGQHQLDFDICQADLYPGDDQFVPAIDPRISDIKHRLAALPDDLQVDVLSACHKAGVPKLTEGKARQHHLQFVWDTLDDVESLRDQRIDMVNAHLSIIPQPEWPSALGHAGIADHVGLIHATGNQEQILGHLADAYTAGILTIDDGQLVLAEGAPKQIVAHFGGKRALLEAARQAAKLYGLTRPTSSAQVEADIALLATTYITVTPLTQTETSKP